MAEFLIKARDPVDLPNDKEKRDRCYRRGDIIVVMPDGHEWGKEERLPKFMVLKIPKMTIEEGKKYIEPYYEDTLLVDKDDKPIRKLTQKRKHKLLIDDISIGSVKTDLTSKDGVAEMSWSNAKTYIYDKITTMTADIAEPVIKVK